MTRLILITALFTSLGMLCYGQETAMKLAEKVTNRIIADTRFEFKLAPQKEVLGMQVINASFLRPKQHDWINAVRRATVMADTTVQFGISAGNAVKVWVNNKLVFQQDGGSSSTPVEIAYDHFRFENKFSVNLKKGINEIMICLEGGPTKPVIFLRAINDMGYLDTSVDFSGTIFPAAWLFAGPFSDDTTIKPQEPVKNYYEAGGKEYNWQTAPQHFIPELVIDSSAAYQRDSYADWQYSHGIMMWSILQLGEATNDSKYTDFVKKYTAFILQHLDYFGWQYDSLYAFRGDFHRIFRRTMLDDTGAPILPFTALYLKEKNVNLLQLVDPIARYVSMQQARLQDGTFCRPEPIEYTVWCDDLFMSVPLLLQMAKATDDQKYYDDAAQQSVNFQKYLLDQQTGLYRHAWFSTTGKQSAVSWGRANGWIAWATAELLQNLPKRHPLYQTILRNFRQQMATLVHYQDQDGMWHQVLDNPASYKETSCTAMFVLALARGMRMGWLPKKYMDNVRKGWEKIASHISGDGVVHGICRGTDIGYDQKFYMERKTIDNDPRGLGAVIAAGIEVAKLK